MTTVAILGNCQSEGLAQAVEALLPDATVIAMQISVLGSRHARQETVDRLRGADVIFAMNLNSAWERFTSDQIGAAFSNVVNLPVFLFTGFQPDTTYLEQPYRHIATPTGGYHSRIVLSGYLSGRSAQETIRLFNPLVYARLGYFGAYQRDIAAVTRMFDAAGLDLGEAVERWCRSGCFMHAINHPQQSVLFDIMRAALNKAGFVAQCDADPAEQADTLEHHAQLPIYPEIAERIGLTGSLRFKIGGVGDAARYIDLPEFVERSYDVYATLPHNALHGIGVDRAIEFLFRAGA
jgi:hypothetical protein